MKKLILTGLLITAPAFASFAESNTDAISERMEIMTNFGKTMKELAPMAKGETDFDAERAQALLNTMAMNATELTDLFPEDSKMGMGRDGDETEASPAIWEDREGFDKMLDKFINDTQMAAESKPDNAEGLGAAINMFAGDCKACHEDYRVKKEK